MSQDPGSKFKFELRKKSSKSKARLGRFHTPHGPVETPIFMPVGTAASVKALTPHQLVDMDARIVLGNTYHLYLRPGTGLIAEAGGLHKFCGYTGPMLTDSGGFQVWSLKELRKIKPNGVEFRSHLDGSKHFFSPQSVMQAQREIGADIIMAFDECTPYPSTPEEALKSLKLTQSWTEMAVEWLDKNPPLHGYNQALFGIAQGGMHLELRHQAIEHLAGLDLPGYALGGLSVGEPNELMYEVAGACSDWLPENKPRYVMGVGTPVDLLELIERGMDLFDCVMPTRNARNGQVFTSQGILHYKAARYAKDLDKPIDPNCSCYTCKNFSRAYLRHLFHADEITVFTLATIHNLHFYLDLMKKARQAIAEERFESWKAAMVPILGNKVPEGM